MATTIRELLVRLGVKADDKAVKRFDGALSSVKTTMVAAAGAAVGVTVALLGMAGAAANVGDEAAKAGARVGITAEEMQELDFAAQQSGASMSDVETSLRRQAVSARDAAAGSKKAAAAYRDVGVEVRGANGQIKPQLQLLEEVADGMATLKTNADRMAVANDIYGRGGSKLLPLLNQQGKGIRDLRIQARLYGAVMSNEATKAAEDFTDRLNEARTVVTGLRNRIGAGLLPVLTNGLERFRDWVLTNRQLIDQRVDRFVDLVTTAAEGLGVAIKEADRRVKEGPGSWEAVFQAVGKAIAAAGIAKALATLITLGKAAVVLFSGAGATISAPFVLLVAVVIAAALAIEDLIVFLRGGESVLGDFLAGFGQAEPVLREMRSALSALVGLLVAVGSAFGGVVSEVAEFLRFGELLEILFTGIDAVALLVIHAVRAGLREATEQMELLTLAFTDFDAFMAQAFGTPLRRLAEFNDRIADTLGKLREFSESVGSIAAAGGAILGGGSGSLLGNVSNRLSSGLLGTLERGARAKATGARELAGLVQPGGNSTTNNTTLQGDTLTVNAQTDLEGALSVLGRRSANRRRQALADAQGGPR